MKRKESPKISKVKNRHSHPYSSYVKELRPVWKKNPEGVKPMIIDMVKKKGGLFGSPILMLYAERFISLHERQIKKFHSKSYDSLKTWASRKTVQFYIELIQWFRMADYNYKYWVTKEYHLSYLDKEIERREKKLVEENENDKYKLMRKTILTELEEGIYPDIRKYDPFLIALVMSNVLFIDFLNKERARLLKRETLSTIKIPIELRKDDVTHEDEIYITIPKDFISTIIGPINAPEAISDQEYDSTIQPGPKLLTRSETAKILNISLPTLDNMTKEGLINCHRIGNTSMKRYKWEDIEEALVKIET